jgi:hypothetical protein
MVPQSVCTPHTGALLQAVPGVHLPPDLSMTCTTPTWQVSTADFGEYRKSLCANIKRVLADLEREWGGAGGMPLEWLVVFVRPLDLDINDRSVSSLPEPGQLSALLSACCTGMGWLGGCSRCCADQFVGRASVVFSSNRSWLGRGARRNGWAPFRAPVLAPLGHARLTH